MDEWFKIIVDALKQKDAHPDIRLSAIVRAGKIAAAYEGCSEDVLSEVFGHTTSVDTAVQLRECAQELRQ